MTIVPMIMLFYMTDKGLPTEKIYYWRNQQLWYDWLQTGSYGRKEKEIYIYLIGIPSIIVVTHMGAGAGSGCAFSISNLALCKCTSESSGDGSGVGLLSLTGGSLSGHCGYLWLSEEWIRREEISFSPPTLPFIKTKWIFKKK